MKPTLIDFISQSLLLQCKDCLITIHNSIKIGGEIYKMRNFITCIHLTAVAAAATGMVVGVVVVVVMMMVVVVAVSKGGLRDEYS